jgi:hypothetical protein
MYYIIIFNWTANGFSIGGSDTIVKKHTPHKITLSNKTQHTKIARTMNDTLHIMNKTH